MRLKTETQYVFVVTDHQPSEGHPELMPIAQLFELRRRLRTLYPDVEVAIRPNGDIELEFKEPFHEDATLELLEREVRFFLTEYAERVS
jgi:hypothetical protein